MSLSLFVSLLRCDPEAAVWQLICYPARLVILDDPATLFSHLFHPFSLILFPSLSDESPHQGERVFY